MKINLNNSKSLRGLAFLTAFVLSLTLLLITVPSKISAAAGTTITLAKDSIYLDISAMKNAELKGKISGDTSSSYYVYGDAIDGSVVSVGNGYEMTDSGFSLNLTAKKVGQTIVTVYIKDIKTSKVVAECDAYVEVKKANTASTEVTCNYDGKSMALGIKSQVAVYVKNPPKSCQFGISTTDGLEWEGGSYNEMSGGQYVKYINITSTKVGPQTMKVVVKDKDTGVVYGSVSGTLNVHEDKPVEHLMSFTGEIVNDTLNIDIDDEYKIIAFNVKANSYDWYSYIDVNTSDEDKFTFIQGDEDKTVSPALCYFVIKPEKIGSFNMKLSIRNSADDSVIDSLVLTVKISEKIPEGLDRIKFDDHVYIQKYHGTDTEVVIPSYIDGIPVTEIGAYAFENSNVEKIVLPETMTVLSDNAFAECKTLKTVVFPSNLKKIGNSAFSDCKGLVEIEIPEGVVSIGETAFYGCSSLKTVIFPKSLVLLGKSSFYGCNMLTKAVFKNPECAIDIGNPEYGEGVTDPFYKEHYEEQGTLTIYGYEDSTAQSIAKLLEYDFKPIEKADSVLYGDVNEDGRVDMMDLILFVRGVIGGWKNISINNVNADTNEDGKLDAADALYIRQAIVGGWTK